MPQGASASRLDTLIVGYLREIDDSEGGSPTEDFVPSRARVAAWIAEGLVKVNGKLITRQSFRPKASDTIAFAVPPAPLTKIEPDSSVPLDIVFEDDSLLVINKQAGLVVHPGAGHLNKTLVNALLHHIGDNLRQIGDALRPGIVHRLDKDTSGLMVVAKTAQAFHGLVRQFQPPRTMVRRYLALACAAPADSSGRSACGSVASAGLIDLPIGRHPVQRQRMAVCQKRGRPARTHWQVVNSFSHAVLLRLSLETGRTHQVRVHLHARKAPIIGDPLYGPPLSRIPRHLLNPVKSFGRQALHAEELAFLHPMSDALVTFRVLPPADMLHLIQLFEAD